ncbi:MAG: GNAT family N-acetyltransferase [Henriciella sp.]
MSDEILIRPATPRDLPTLLRFEQGIVTAERPYDHTLKPDPISYYDVGAMIEAPDCEVAVAEVDGQLIGSGYAAKKASRHYVHPPFHAYIGFLYVEPDFRGRGVNKKVLDHLFAWAKANDLPEIHLTVYPDNDAAVRAYEKAGFDRYILEMRLNLDEKT